MSVSGTTLRARSVAVSGLLTPETAPGFEAFVNDVGGVLDQVTLASAFDPSGLLPGSISALRVPGANPATLRSAYVRLEVSQANPPPTVSHDEIGGRLVDALVVGSGGVVRYVFSSADVLFIVDALDESTGTAFIEAVP
jgi:hypothetical protein